MGQQLTMEWPLIIAWACFYALASRIIHTNTYEIKTSYLHRIVGLSQRKDFLNSLCSHRMILGSLKIMNSLIPKRTYVFRIDVIIPKFVFFRAENS